MQEGDRFWMVRASRDPLFCFAQKEGDLETKKILISFFRFEQPEDGNVSGFDARLPSTLYPRSFGSATAQAAAHAAEQQHVKKPSQQQSLSDTSDLPAARGTFVGVVGEISSVSSSSAAESKVLVACTLGTQQIADEHLACVLNAAFVTLKDMKELVAYVKTKSTAFKVVQLSSQSDGAYTKVQLAERVAKCRPDGVTNANELLSWLMVSAQ